MCINPPPRLGGVWIRHSLSPSGPRLLAETRYPYRYDRRCGRMGKAALALLGETSMKFLKTAAVIAGYPAIFVVGLLAGGYVGAYVIHGNQVTSSSADPDFERAAFEYALESKDEAIRARALNAHLEYLNWTAGDERSFPSYLASDRGLTLARLSALWQRLGDQTQSALYLEKATSYCPEMKWRHCDGNELLINAARLDRGAIEEIFNKKR